MVVEVGGLTEGHENRPPCSEINSARNSRSWCVQELLCYGGELRGAEEEGRLEQSFLSQVSSNSKIKGF